jgi:hypothetical protein
MADRVEVFAAYARLAAQMIAGATKEQFAEEARLLALNTGWYHQRYGDVPQEELLRMVRGETLDEDGRRLRLDGNQGQTKVSQLDRQVGGARAHERGRERAGARVEYFELSGSRLRALSRREQDQALGPLLAGKRPSTGRSARGVRERAVNDPERTLALRTRTAAVQPIADTVRIVAFITEAAPVEYAT